jgi:hypothetical protein
MGQNYIFKIDLKETASIFRVLFKKFDTKFNFTPKFLRAFSEK